MKARRPQGSYFAKRCPERVQLDVLRPCEPLEDPSFLRQLARQGAVFEGEIFAMIVTGAPGVRTILRDPEDKEQWERATIDALRASSSIVLGGRLPVDFVGRRAGEPDLLVRAGATTGPGVSMSYFPVDVKSHMALERAEVEGDGSALVSEVTNPWKHAAVIDTKVDRANASVTSSSLLTTGGSSNTRGWRI